jgi:hypothetical protein
MGRCTGEIPLTYVKRDFDLDTVIIKVRGRSLSEKLHNDPPPPGDCVSVDGRPAYGTIRSLVQGYFPCQFDVGCRTGDK